MVSSQQNKIKIENPKINNLELLRDGGSFKFIYKNVNYNCTFPTFVLEANKETVTNLILILEIIKEFDVLLLTDKKFSNLVNNLSLKEEA